MRQYLELVKKVLEEGSVKKDRTGVGTRSIFGYQYRVDLNEGFPLLTTKKLHLKSIIYELLWMLQGRTDVKWLNDRGVTIWDEWKKKDGTIGPGYGAQWRYWYKRPKYHALFWLDEDRYENLEITDNQIDEGYLKFDYIDQISNVIEQIKTNPDSRRLIVSAWNVADIEEMALPPCHLLFQFYVQDNKLSCQLYQR